MRIQIPAIHDTASTHCGCVSRAVTALPQPETQLMTTSIRLPRTVADRPSNAGGAVTRVLVFLSICGLVVLAIVGVIKLMTTSGYSPIGIMGAPVFVGSGDDGRAYLLTGQWRTYRTGGGRSSSGTWRSDLYVDLWAIHAADAKPIWRKRLETERGGGMIDRSLLGVDRGTIWLLMKGKLVGMSAADGSVIASAGRVEAENPELKGLMPVEDRYYQFDLRGLHITAADARGWRIDPSTFKVLPDTGPAVPIEGACPPEFITPGSSGLHLVRGIDAPGHWLGLLTEDEAKIFEENNTIGGMTPETRRRVWGGKALKDTNFFGEYLDYADLKPLPESPEFLDAGLLREYHTAAQLPALWAREPDSVFVLYRDRLGQAGKLRLARVGGPEGKVIWDAALPLTYVQSVKKMEKTMLIFGKEYIEGDPEISDALRDSPERLVAVEIGSGAVHVHSHSALDTHPEAEAVDLGL